MPSCGITALGAVKAAKIREGQRVLIHGSSGGVGHFAVQIAKALGAVVTGVCSTRNLAMARSIGTDCVIDYKQEDFSQKGKTYDAIIAVNGYNPLSVYKKMLNKGGSYIAVGGAKQAIMGFLGSSFYSIGSGKTFGAVAFPFMPRQAFLTEIKKRAEEDSITPFIDEIYPVQDITKAIKYIVTDHAQGKVVIKISF